MRRLAFALLGMWCIGTAQGQQNSPDLNGYVTSVTSGSEFAVDGNRVVCEAKTRYRKGNDASTKDVPWANAPYLGQPLQVFGKKDHKNRTMVAKEIVTQYPGFAKKEVYGVIDRVLTGNQEHPGRMVVRAGGYPILIDGKTTSSFTPPLRSLADVGTNTWIEAKGELQLNGLILATRAVFTRNAVAGHEENLRTKNEYDPAKVDPDKKQSAFSKAMIGVKVKRIPPYEDPATQARIDRIGSSLVPQYQQALPAGDPTRINFRFRLVDTPWHFAYSFANGIILVPIHVVDRMQNDAQVAAILADAMATVLEKQDYRGEPAKYAMEVAGYSADGGGFFVPGLGLGAGLGLAMAESTIERHNQEESGRVSLGILSDAQFDLTQAPIAWWLLGSEKPKDISDIPIPERSRYLYSVLGELWRTGQLSLSPDS